MRLFGIVDLRGGALNMRFVFHRGFIDWCIYFISLSFKLRVGIFRISEWCLAAVNV